MLGFLAVILAILVAAALIQMWRDLPRIVTVRDFCLHGEHLNLSYFVGTLVATNLSLGNMIFVCAAFGYAFGWSGVLWMALTIAFVGIGFHAFVHRFGKYIEQRGNFGTIHDFIASSHANSDLGGAFRLKQLTAIVSCLSLFLAIIVEVHLATQFLRPLVGLHPALLVAIFVFGICAYTAGAGFYSVVFTDILQCILVFTATVAGIVLIATMPVTLTFTEAGYTSDVTNLVTGIGAPAAIGLVVLGFFWMIATPDTWQRNCAARSVDTSLRGTWLGTAIMIVLVSLFAIGGMSVKATVEPNLSVDVAKSLSQGSFPLNDIFLLDFAAMGVWQSLLAAMIAAGLLMAAASTVDTFLIVIGHAINVDLGLSGRGIRTFNEIRDLEAPLLIRGRLFVLLLSFAIVIGWFLMNWGGFLSSPIALFFAVYTLQFTLGVPAIAATFPALRNAPLTFFVVSASAVLTVIAGTWLLANETSNAVYFGLKPIEWLSLLPCLPVVIGVVGYAVAAKSGPVRDSQPRASK